MKYYVLRRDILKEGLDYEKLLKMSKMELDAELERQQSFCRTRGVGEPFLEKYSTGDLMDLISLDEGAFRPMDYFLIAKDPTVYVGRWDLLEGGIEDVESFSEEDAIEELKREEALDNDTLIDTYTLEEFEAEFNNDLDEENPFSLRYWIKIF